MTRILSSAMVALFSCCVANGQTAEARPAFEVASIKPSDPTQTVAIRRSGYRLSTSNTSLQMLLTWAYDVYGDRLYGKPSWLDAVHYDVVANAPRDGPEFESVPGQPGPLQQMMQTLLEDRFKLVIHRETRDLPIYALVVAKGGPKVHPVPSSDAIGQNPFRMPGRGRLIGSKVSTEMLAKVLSGQVSYSVQDRTELQGVFDFTLEWEPETQSTGIDDGSTQPAGIRAGPSLFTALQEQLGLKLEPRKGPAEVLVIDHIERTPTEN